EMPAFPRAPGAKPTFAERAAAALAAPARDPPGLWESRRLFEPERTPSELDKKRAAELAKSLGVERGALIDRTAEILVDLDGKVFAEHLDAALADALVDGSGTGARRALRPPLEDFRALM